MLVLGVTIAFHLLIPAALLSWRWWSIDRSRLEWLLKTLAIGAYLVLLLRAGIWIVPIQAADGRWRTRIRAAICGAASASFITAALYAWMGHRPFDEEAVDLAFPLHEGTYYIISGGSNALMNLHSMTLRDQRFRRFRGQSYAVDIVKLNRYGIRASSPWPGKLGAYEIFGDAVYAPCSGTVARAENALADLVPPQRDRTNLAGNFVAIDCKGVRVLLAHLKQGSILVKTGEGVAASQKLGQIGNSGNTDEPHLHIHAERPMDTAKLLDAEPVPIRFDGRFLARNDQVRAY